MTHNHPRISISIKQLFLDFISDIEVCNHLEKYKKHIAWNHHDVCDAKYAAVSIILDC